MKNHYPSTSEPSETGNASKTEGTAKSNALGTEKMGRLLMQISLPATMGMLVNALYNIIDTVYVSWGVGPDAIGGLTIAFPIQMVLMGIAQMIGIGAASLISIRLGAKDRESADKIAGNAYMATLFLSVLFVLLGLFFLDPLLRLFGATDALLPYAHQYMQVILVGSCFFTFVMSVNAMIRAEGNAMMAMMTMLIGTFLNVILAPIFIFWLHMGVTGAAIATVISQMVSFAFMVRYIFFGESALAVKPHHLIPDFKILTQITTIGFPALMRNIGGSLLAIVLNYSLAIYGGNTAIIAYGLINRLFMFLFLPMVGIVQGLQPIVGYNFGAGNYPRIREGIKLSALITLSIGTLGWVLCVFAPQWLVALFTHDPQVLKDTIPALRMFAFMAPILGLQLISATLFQAIGKALPSLVLSTLRQFILLLPLVLILPRLFHLGLTGIWLAFPISDGLSTLISVALVTKQLSSLKQQLAPSGTTYGEAAA